MSPKHWLQFILLGLIWGSSFLWIKIAVQEIGPFTLVTLRVLFALLGLVVVLIARRSRVPLRKKLGVFLFLGLCNVALPFVLIAWGEKSIPSGLASILNSTVPLFTILIGPFFLSEERLTLPRLTGLLVGFAGVVVLMSEKVGSEVSNYRLGILAGLAGALLYAVSAVFARRNTQGLQPEVQSTGQILMASLLITPSAVLVEAPFSIPHLPITWLAVAWLGLLGSCVATILYYSLLHAIGPTRTLLTTYIFPLVGVLLGLVFLAEPLTWRLLAGGLLIISGIAVVNSNFRFRSRQA